MPSQKLVNDLLSGISNFSLDISVDGKVKEPSITVVSDLDKQLSKGMSKMITKATRSFEKELKAGIMAKAGSSSKGLSSDLGDTGSLLNSKKDALGDINTNFSSSSGGGLGLPMKLF